MLENNENKTRISRNIKNLFLDPNNYRFVDDKEYKKISDENVIDERVQLRTRSFIEGDKIEKIKDLIDSFKANGFLKVDIIQAKDLGNNNYLVIEGNRRVAALKYLQEQYKRGFKIGKLDAQIFSSVPFEIHDRTETDNHLIVMGLKHISGNKKWATINQAQLIYDYLKPFENDRELYFEKELELCNSLAITKQKIRTSQRTYNLILVYKNSDFGDQFESNMYSMFEEIVKRPTIKDWIDWDDKIYKAMNYTNLERLFSWMSYFEETTEEDEDLSDEEKNRDPIITKAFEIRDLGSIINDNHALAILEEKKSVAKALQSAGVEDRNSIDKSINTVKSNIRTIRRYTDILEEEDKKELRKIYEEIDEILPKRVNLDILGSNSVNCFQHVKVNHFTNITIEEYKLFRGFKLGSLNRINILVGTNNSGKTTLLESIYLLCNQNDIGSLFSLTKSRSKLLKMDPNYLESSIDKQIKISGEFFDCKISVEIDKYEDAEVEKYDDYVTSVSLRGRINDEESITKIHTYEFNPMKREYNQIKHICNSFFSSPYMYDIEKLVSIYNKSLNSKTDEEFAYDKVIRFIQKVDPTIKRIFYTENNGEKKFVVDSFKFNEGAVDLTSYGEGIFRVFELALSFASCRNGVLLIDEFETAIHYSLLKDFTRFVQELSIEFNVQVFLSTHSKECVDAFVKNGYRNEDISAYLIYNAGDSIDVKQIDGEELKYLIDSINLDIRGGIVNEN
jgi:AAA15 family ATPase/GTPase